MVTTSQHGKVSHVPRVAHKVDHVINKGAKLESSCTCDQGHQTGSLSPTDCKGRFCCRFGIKCSNCRARVSRAATTELVPCIGLQQNWNFGTGAPSWHLQICIFLSQNLCLYPDRWWLNCSCSRFARPEQFRAKTESICKLLICSTDFKRKGKKDTPAFIPVFY